MTKLTTLSAVTFAAAIWLGTLVEVSFGQDKIDPKLTPAGLQSQIESLSSELESVRTEFGQRLNRIEALIDSRNTSKDETSEYRAPSDGIIADPARKDACCKTSDGYQACCGRSERDESCCKYVDHYQPCCRQDERYEPCCRHVERYEPCCRHVQRYPCCRHVQRYEPCCRHVEHYEPCCRHVQRYEPCCRHVQRDEPCCRYVERYQPCCRDTGYYERPVVRYDRHVAGPDPCCGRYYRADRYSGGDRYDDDQ
jgi:hypothetical protein